MKKHCLICDKFNKLFITGVFSFIVYLLSSISDTILSGLFLGEQALAAVEVVNPFYSFIAFVALVFTPGAQVLFSNFIGKGDHKKANEVFGLSFTLSLLFGCLTALAMFLFKDQFLGIFSLSEEVRNYASDYYNWFIAIAIFYPIYMSTYRFACEDGDAIIPLIADIGEMVANIVFSIIGVKTMGVAGLGFGTFISIIVSILIVSVHFFKKSNSVKLGFKFSFDRIKNMTKLSFGTSLTCLFVSIVDLVMNFFITKHFGDSFLASYSIINVVINLSELFVYVTASMAPIVAISNGAKNIDDMKLVVNKALKKMIRVCLIATAIVSGFCWLLPNCFGITSDSSQYFYSWMSALIIGSTLITYGFMYMFIEVDVDLGDSRSAVLVTVLASLIFPICLPIGFAYLFELIFQTVLMAYVGLIIGFAITPVLAFIIVGIFEKSIHKNKKFFEFPDYGEEQFSFDLYLGEKEIIETRTLIENKLKELGINPQTIMNTLVVLEDLLFIIYYENENKKILDRITICVSEKQIRILNKDNGKVFRISEKANKDEYFFFNMVPKKNSFQNSLAMSFNTVSLVINRH